MSDSPDSNSERFRILRKLGSGGMGEVYLAQDTVLRRRVALKKLFDSHVTDADARRNLLREARAAARLNHPNIASIYDVIESDGGASIVMEYVPGDTLSTRLKSHHAFESDEAIRIAIQLGDALAAAHSVGVIHRDLKPANVMLTPHGTVKILDFGLARTQRSRDVSSRDLQAKTASTASTEDEDERHSMAGTLAYMPPETLLGNVSDARGDIYSAGVTLFELLTGRWPFAGANATALIAAITSQKAPKVSDIQKNVSEDLSAIVARAMARQPNDRYPSARAFTEALRRIGDRRSRIRRWLSVGASAAAVILAGLWVSQHPEWFTAEPDQKVIAVLPFVSLSADSLTGYVAAGITDVVGANLASLPVLVVPSAETAGFRGSDRDLNAVGSELGASLLIAGGVQKYGDQLRVTLTMSRVGSKALDWTHICDGDASNVLRLQEQILSVLPEGLLSVGFLSNTPDATTRERLTKPPTQNEEAYADYTQARSFLERDDMPENIPRAIALFEAAFDKDPRFAAAVGGLAEAYYAQYRRTADAEWAHKAIAATETALDIDSLRTNVRYSRSLILYGIGALDMAEPELERVIKAEPNYDAAHALLADVYEKQGRKHEAIRELHAAIDLRRSYWRYHWRLGRVLLAHGKLEEARRAAQRVIELQPDNQRGYQLLGTIYQAQGRTDDAMEAYDASLKLTPTPAAYSNIGSRFFDEGDYERATIYYRKAMELDPKRPVYYRNLGDTLLELGRTEESRDVFRTAVSLADSILVVDPRDTRTLALQALCFAKLSDDVALDRISQAEQLTPANPDILYKKTAILALLGHGEEALQTLKKAIDVGVPRSFAAKDPDLRSISDTEEFKSLVGQ